MSDIVPTGALILGRATINIAVGVMQIVSFGVAGLLLVRSSTTEILIGSAAALPPECCSET